MYNLEELNNPELKFFHFNDTIRKKSTEYHGNKILSYILSEQ